MPPEFLRFGGYESAIPPSGQATVTGKVMIETESEPNDAWCQILISYS